MRRQCWEAGNIDYLGKDSFDNIWARISKTIDSDPAKARSTSPEAAAVTAVEAATATASTAKTAEPAAAVAAAPPSKSNVVKAKPRKGK